MNEAVDTTAIAAFAVGHLWRYRRDQYRWGARSTQLLESRTLRYGSTLLGFTHGKDEPHAKLPLIMAQEVPELWNTRVHAFWQDTGRQSAEPGGAARGSPQT